ncbi:hypothetical protein Rleg10DRAFT_2013 [Rhizobium leguminosarum bv. trifolii WSM2012]|nr:hypothetical protein Rleg10DRAFT_2013 [Rhizobium leguminosarum bv. trifolii WSM2012]
MFPGVRACATFDDQAAAQGPQWNAVDAYSIAADGRRADSIGTGRGSTELGVLRRRLAVQYGAGACCPVTVQRHLRAIVELAFGVLEKGEPVSTVTPYWRMVDPLATRLAGGPSRIPERLAAEPRQGR